MPRFVVAVLAFAWLSIGVAATEDLQRDGAGQDAEMVASGQRMYRDGLLPTGKPMQGLAQADVQRSGKDAACAACHRRSGLGTSEGQFNIRPISALALFQGQPVTAPNPRIAHQLGTPVRRPYDDALLARAIRDGVDVTGAPLNPLMPRYALDDAQMEPLIAYLKTLSSGSSPGVDGEDIHLATVIQPSVAPAERNAMLQIIETFVRDKNAGTRSELHRREAGGMRMHRSYRTWVHHVWDLSGPSESWGDQLEALYQRQPVFAMVSGLGNSSWRPIHEFSERFELPCIFPQADLPVVSGDGFYTIYLSKGLLLEADVLAKYLRDQPTQGRVIQVYGRDEAGSAVAREFRAAMGGARQIEDRVVDGPATESFWEQLASETSAAVIVSWLPKRDLDSAGRLVNASPQLKAVYFSSTLLSDAHASLAMQADARFRVIYPLELPSAREARQSRARLWLRSKNIPLTDEKLQINTYFAVTLTGDVLSHIMDSFSRDYFVERIEHEVTKSLSPSIYPHVSLGPGQRFASKGSYIIPLGGIENRDFKPLSAWIVP